MFAKNSRYISQTIYLATTATGAQVPATTLPLPPLTSALAGFYQRKINDRLDLVAASYLSDPTWFWKLCNANSAMVPDALAARPLIGIPTGYNT